VTPRILQTGGPLQIPLTGLLTSFNRDLASHQNLTLSSAEDLGDLWQTGRQSIALRLNPQRIQTGGSLRQEEALFTAKAPRTALKASTHISFNTLRSCSAEVEAIQAARQLLLQTTRDPQHGSFCCALLHR